MPPNPFLSLLHSRKFLLMMLDGLVASILYVVGKYEPSAMDDVKMLFALWQPVVVAVILSIAVEDSAAIRASGVSPTTVINTAAVPVIGTTTTTEVAKTPQ